MSGWPLVSVVILNYNGQRNLGVILKSCLFSVLSADYPNFEVLFVDNASSDGSVEFVHKEFGKDRRLKIVCNERNLGFAEGNNVGVRSARGEYIVLLNSDTQVDSQWLKELVKAAQPRLVGAVQSKLVQMNAPDLLDCAGGLVDYYGYHFERGRGEKAAKFNQAVEVFYGKGASLLLKRNVLNMTGLFDPEIFLYFDEVDLCWRVWLSGHKVVFAPKSVVLHASGSTASKVQEKKRAYFYARNHILILLKNYDLENAFKSVAVSVLFETRNAALSMLRRKPQLSIATINALLWNLFNLRRIWSERQRVQKLVRMVPDQKIRKVQLEPYPPFPLYLVFTRSRYQTRKIDS
jgi:GT2 family glycosyltransferase